MIECRHFNGYKPCGKSEICDSLCPQLSVPPVRILMIHLEALGAVTRSTALMPAIRRRHPGAHITWITQKPADQILANHPMIDRVMTTTADDMLQLSALEFDLAYVIDKGQKAAGVLKATKADMVYGFVVDARTGAVLPATDSARELWEIGLSDRKKFYENTKPETRLAHEALDLGPWLRDEYHVRLTSAERVEAGRRRIEWAGSRPFVVGINTGCSGIIQAKKLTVEAQREIVRRLSKLGGFRVVLLGGKEDSLRNERIGAGLDVVQTPTDQGLRDGIISVAACDIVVSGDSLGLHLAIALQKWTVAWFGPTCAHEIDLYDRGVRVLTGASCSPCWKRNCDKSPMCYDLVSIDEIVTGVEAGARRILAERDSCPLPPTIALERD
ncbi:MAG: glycosyltransferase family 9 protein [Bdellovibrionota bacterium]